MNILIHILNNLVHLLWIIVFEKKLAYAVLGIAVFVD